VGSLRFYLDFRVRIIMHHPTWSWLMCLISNQATFINNPSKFRLIAVPTEYWHWVNVNLYTNSHTTELNIVRQPTMLLFTISAWINKKLNSLLGEGLQFSKFKLVQTFMYVKRRGECNIFSLKNCYWQVYDCKDSSNSSFFIKYISLESKVKIVEQYRHIQFVWEYKGYIQ